MNTELATTNGNGNGTALQPIRLDPPAVIGPRFDFDKMERFAERLAKSGLFKGVSTPDQAFTLIMLCDAENLHPAEAMKRYYIVEGQPTIKAIALQAEFQTRGGKITWMAVEADRVKAKFSHPLYCPEGLVIEVTLDEFIQSGLAMTYDKERREWVLKTNWRRSTIDMLRSRCVTRAIRLIAPGLACGIYTDEEIRDIESPAVALDSPPALAALPTPEILPATPSTRPVRQESVSTEAPDTWDNFIRGLFKDTKAAWDAELTKANKTAPAGFRVVEHANQAMHAVVSACVEAGYLEPAEILKPGSDTRDVDACKRAVKRLYEQAGLRDHVRSFAVTWINEKLEDAREACGLTEPTPEPSDAMTDSEAREEFGPGAS